MKQWSFLEVGTGQNPSRFILRIMATIWFEDIHVGDCFQFGPYHVRREELVAFNARWDPLPIHLDDDAAREKGLKSLTASGQYTFCIKQYMLNDSEWKSAVIGALGFDEVRFPNPVYPGDTITLSIECLETRPSRSKRDRGIVRFRFLLTNQTEEPVLEYLDTVMFSRRKEVE